MDDPKRTDRPVHVPEDASKRSYWSPYAAGCGIGITLLLAYWFLGTGLGASGALANLAAWISHRVAPDHVAGSAYFGQWFGDGSPHILLHYLVFMGLGIFVGGVLSAVGSKRIEPMVERGPRISRGGRLWLALAGGIVAGFAARLARGCTSGQALSGTALMLTGSTLFLVCMFLGGYAAALFVRRQWR